MITVETVRSLVLSYETPRGRMLSFAEIISGLKAKDLAQLRIGDIPLLLEKSSLNSDLKKNLLSFWHKISKGETGEFLFSSRKGRGLRPAHHVSIGVTLLESKFLQTPRKLGSDGKPLRGKVIRYLRELGLRFLNATQKILAPVLESVKIIPVPVVSPVSSGKRVPVQIGRMTAWKDPVTGLRYKHETGPQRI